MAEPGTKPKPKAEPKKLTKKEQAERFRKTARELECDESEGALDRALEKVARPKVTGS